MNKKMIICNIGFIAIFIAAYSVNINLMIVAAIIPTAFILFNNNLSLGISELLFLLPFSQTMTISTGTTSLFMLPKLALLFIYCVKNKFCFNKKIVLALATLLLYSLFINVFKANFPIVRILNLVLWFFIAFILCQTIKKADDMKIISSSFVAGVIVSGIIGMLKEYLPNLAKYLISAQYLNESTGNIVQRFSGLWNDPNGYTIFLICSLFALFWLINNKYIKIIGFAVFAAIISALGIMTLSKSCAILLIMFWAYFLISNQGMSMKQKLGFGFVFVVLCVLGASLYENELSELVYRFTSSNQNGSGINFAALTTHRSAIWNEYINAIWQGDFAFGYGIDAPLVGGYACHNTYLQLIYEWGILGTLFYVVIWVCMVLKDEKAKQNYVPLFFLLVTIFFISCVYIESIYFMIPFLLCIGVVCRNDEEVL